jgi:hypothetical protein
LHKISKMVNKFSDSQKFQKGQANSKLILKMVLFMTKRHRQHRRGLAQT